MTANAAPAAGRVLLGDVQVRTDTNVLVGQGDVVVQSVTPSRGARCSGPVAGLCASSARVVDGATWATTATQSGAKTRLVTTSVTWWAPS